LIDNFSQAYPGIPEGMDNNNQTEERRNAQRFFVSWEVTVKGTDRTGRPFSDVGVLQDLSSRGALLCLPRPVNLGERFELQIKVPLRRSSWIRYTAEVVRLDLTHPAAGVGVEFGTALPDFVGR